MEISDCCQNAYFKSMKQSRRKEDDIALVNAAFYVEMSNNVVKDAEFVFGGMSATSAIAQRTKSLIIKREWSENTLEAVYLELLKDLPLASNAPGGMVAYRKTLALRWFYSFILVLSKIVLVLVVVWQQGQDQYGTGTKAKT